VDFLFVLIEFFARCYGRDATSEYLLQIGVFRRVLVSFGQIFT